MRVCVLEPSYDHSNVDHRNYDPPRDLARLLPENEVRHVFLDKRTTYRQLRQLRREGYDIYVNLCEGYLDWDVPSIDVIHSLALLGVPYTGPSAELYDPPKELIKRVAWYAGVAVPEFVRARSMQEVDGALASLRFPLFVKPDRGGDSLGIDAVSLCRNERELRAALQRTVAEFDEAIIDEYLPGREFSVLVAGAIDSRKEPIAFRPVEFVFPPGQPFKTYSLKTTEYHPECNVPCTDPTLDRALRSAACAVFRSFGGVGYCRMDFRLDAHGTPSLLDANFACSVFYAEGSYGTADYILMHDGFGQARFLGHIIAEGLARHRASQPVYEVFGSPLAGYGIRARRALVAGELVFCGEERAQRIATRRHVLEAWSPPEAEAFRRYAYPVSDEVRILWDADPACWSPPNHSCEPNTGFVGLDMVALRDIAAGEELTFDYSTVYDQDMEPFDCHCGTRSCRGRITGTPGNSVDRRERVARQSLRGQIS